MSRKLSRRCKFLRVVTRFNTRWFKYDRDYLCVNKSQFVPVIFEPPCIFSDVKSQFHRRKGRWRKPLPATRSYLFTAFMAEYQRVYHFQQSACLYNFGYLNHCEGSSLQTNAANQGFLRRRVVLRSIVCSLVSFLHTWPPSSVPTTLLKAEAISTPCNVAVLGRRTARSKVVHNALTDVYSEPGRLSLHLVHPLQILFPVSSPLQLQPRAPLWLPSPNKVIPLRATSLDMPRTTRIRAMLFVAYSNSQSLMLTSKSLTERKTKHRAFCRRWHLPPVSKVIRSIKVQSKWGYSPANEDEFPALPRRRLPVPNWCAMSVDRSCSVSTSFWLLGTERGGKIFESSG